MKTKSIMLIAVSLGFGLIAAIGMSQVLGQKASDSVPEVEMVQVYVASKSLDIGDELKLDENLNVKKRPITDVPENAIKSAEELENMVAIQKVPKDVLLVTDFIMDKNLANLGKQPPKGMRAFTIKTELEDTHHNSIQAGDRIDIVGVFKLRNRRDGKELRAPSTFLKNIEVWQVNDKDYIGVDGEENERISTITVLLTPKQVEIAILAQDVASVVRVIKTNREIDGTEGDEEEFDLATLTGLFNDSQEDEEAEAKKKEEAKSKESEKIAEMQKMIEKLNQEAKVAAAAPKKVEYKHRMTIYKGGQIINYGFQENKELPTVISQTVSTSNTPEPQLTTPSAGNDGNAFDAKSNENESKESKSSKESKEIDSLKQEIQ